MIMTAGLPTGSKRPVNCSPPAAELMRNEVIESPFLVARIEELAAGIDRQAARIVGVHPGLGNHPQRPSFATEKIATVLCSRFAAYTNRPSRR